MNDSSGGQRMLVRMILAVLTKVCLLGREREAIERILSHHKQTDLMKVKCQMFYRSNRFSSV
jgi:hypothetical protein